MRVVAISGEQVLCVFMLKNDGDASPAEMVFPASRLELYECPA